MKKDKEKVIDEVWTEDHIRSFLDVRARDGGNDDFHMLLKAYQSMRAEDFALFVEMFQSQQRDINATGREGISVLDIVSEHRQGGAYANVLRSAGARR